jgi:hypothetical protein
MQKQQSIIFEEDRELTEKEYMNLSKKVNGGYIPVDYLRKNLFNATVRDSKELKRKKVIYNDKQVKITINRSLHQKHRDLLSLLFTDNRGVSKPNKDGSYIIYTNIYDLAKKMNYKSPKNSTNSIYRMLNDLSMTRLEIEDEIGILRHNLIAEDYYDKDTGKYMVRIPSMTAKYHIFNWGIQIPQNINREIILIPDKLSKLKALISFILSNKALKNGVSFSSVCDKLDILDSPNKSRFKKQIKDNQELLNKFNIKYDEARKIFYYENIKQIDFEKALNSKDIDEEIKLKEIGGYEILIGEKVRFSTPMDVILVTIISVKVKDDKFLVVGKDEKGYEIEFPYTKDRIRQFIQNTRDRKLGLKEIDIVKRDFLHRPFKQNIQSSMGGLEEAIFEILDFKPTEEENRFIAVIKGPDGTVRDSTSSIDRKLLLGLNWL